MLVKSESTSKVNGFGEIETYFKFIDFQNQLKLNLSFIAEIYLVRG